MTGNVTFTCGGCARVFELEPLENVKIDPETLKVYCKECPSPNTEPTHAITYIHFTPKES